MQGCAHTHSQGQELGEAAGSPLGLELEDASLGNVHRLRELSKGNHIIEEGGLDLGFPFPEV